MTGKLWGHWAGGLACALAVSGAAHADDLASRIAQELARPPELDAKAALLRATALDAAARADPAASPATKAQAAWALAHALLQTGAPDRALAITVDALKGLAPSREACRLLEAKARAELDMAQPEAAAADANAAEAMAIGLFGKASPDLTGIESAQVDIMGSTGRLPEAIAYARRVLAHGEPAPHWREEYIAALGSLAVYLSRYGDDIEGLDASRQAMTEVRRLLPDGHHDIAVILTNYATDLSRFGRFREAESIGREALGYTRSHFGPNAVETGAAMMALTSILRQSGAHAEAQAMGEAGLATLERAGLSQENPHLIADANRVLAYVAIDAGQPDLAELRLRAALVSLEAMHDHKGFYSNVQSTLGEVLLRKGDIPAALAAVETALVYFRKALAPYAGERVDAEMLRTLILARMGHAADALRDARPVIDAMVAHMTDARLSAHTIAQSTSTYRANFGRFTEIATLAGAGEDALRGGQYASWSEISATSRMIAARTAGNKAGAADLIRAVEADQVRIEHLEREHNFAMGRAPQQAARAEADLAAANAGLDANLSRLRALVPDYDRLTRPAPVTIADAVSGLGAETAILLPVMSNDRLVTLVINHAGQTSAVVPLDYARARQAVQTLRRALEGEDAAHFDPAAAWTLGRAVFNPRVAAALGRVSEVAVVGSGPLMTVPFGMLLTAPPTRWPLGQQPYAVRRHAFSVRPLLAPAAAPPAGTAQAFLGVGAPALGPADTVLRGGNSLWRGAMGDAAALRELPSLPATAHELDTIARTIPNAGNRLLTGAQATEAQLRAQPLDRFGVIAFATHGLVGGEMRGLDEPALVLTPPDGNAASSDNDGLLTASEAAGLSLHARWVILSACNTGAGSDSGAGGYSGLARGFIQAGADSLLVSLWPLRDDAAARLTVDTVRFHAAGESQAQALRHAQLRLMRDAHVPDAGNPAVWAPFSLVRQ